MQYITIIECIIILCDYMTDEFDKIKTTITISLYTKNKLRELKGNMSYEDFINHLIRSKEKNSIGNKNYIELQTLKRGKVTYSIDEYKILFSYNEHNQSDHFQFDIDIELVRKQGKKISFEQLLDQLNTADSSNKIEFTIYFKLLEYVIQKEIEPIYTHKGRFEDHYLWDVEFKKLGLPKTSFEEDVLMKLKNYEKGLHYDS